MINSSTKNDPCCDKQDIINNKGTNVCRGCGTVNGYQIAEEYVDFHENKYQIKKKSVHKRKYNFENIIKNICSKYELQISVHDLDKVHQIFIEIGKSMVIIKE